MIDNNGDRADLEAFHSRRNPEHVVVVLSQGDRASAANLLLNKTEVVQLREELWVAMNRAWPPA